ncbi:hypothetical protein [Streptomyces triticiradicis]|uniref:Uncharacterized protein n=1 Tax=Streptomyces triticiradicis TaxID=2651189 RepID=A0A7J5DML1_9ACTN|nr:hypothetical protein [Streptomyces triticiradicis]KAB1989939.1 hypothetical protein F8144_06265 [Streptomyces triticiradicis]
MARPGRNGTSRVAARRVELVLPGVLEFLRTRVRPRRKKYLLAGVMVWSLVVTPTAVFLGGRSEAWGLVSVVPGSLSLVSAPFVADVWDFRSGSGLRERLAVAPVVTAAVFLVAGPFLVPTVLHETAGHPVRARMMEVGSTHEGGTGDDGPEWISYRIADAVTEQDLGPLLYGLPEWTPAGTVIEVSVVPGGWSPPVSAERLDDGGARPYVTVFAGTAAAHVLVCAAAWFGWPRKDAR